MYNNIRQIIGHLLIEEYDELCGEWWIIDGSATYADGDSGDMNHEMVVIDAMIRDLADYCGIEYSEMADFDETMRGIYEHCDEADISLEQLIDAAGLPNTKMVAACLSGGHVDPREYAMKYWGWKRVVDNNVETWELEESDRNNIVRGLEEIAMELDGTTEIHLYVYKANKSFSMTIDELAGVGVGDNPTMDWHRNAANMQAREADIRAMHPAYQRLTSPIGDDIQRIGKYI